MSLILLENINLWNKCCIINIKNSFKDFLIKNYKLLNFKNKIIIKKIKLYNIFIEKFLKIFLKKFFKKILLIKSHDLSKKNLIKILKKFGINYNYKYFKLNFNFKFHYKIFSFKFTNKNYLNINFKLFLINQNNEN